MQLQKLVNMFGGDLSRRYGQRFINSRCTADLAVQTVMAPSDAADVLSVMSPRLPMKHSSTIQLPSSLSIRRSWSIAPDAIRPISSLYQHLRGSTGAAFDVSTGGQRANIVGLCVGTRPDCVPDAVLDLLCEYKDLGYEVWLELGLQTAHDKTLHRINRGHDFACYQNTTRLARARAESVLTPDCWSAGRRTGRLSANHGTSGGDGR